MTLKIEFALKEPTVGQRDEMHRKMEKMSQVAVEYPQRKDEEVLEAVKRVQESTQASESTYRPIFSTESVEEDKTRQCSRRVASYLSQLRTPTKVSRGITPDQLEALTKNKERQSKVKKFNSQALFFPTKSTPRSLDKRTQ